MSAQRARWSAKAGKDGRMIEECGFISMRSGSPNQEISLRSYRLPGLLEIC